MQSLCIVFVGFLPFLFEKSQHSLHTPRIGIVLVNLQSFVNPFFCCNGITLIHIGLGLHEVCAGVLLPFLYESIQLQLARFIVFVLKIACSTVVPVILVCGLLFYGLGIVGYGICEVLLPDACYTSKVIEFRNIRIQFQSFRSVAFCSLPVVKIVLCYRPELPRFPQIRLCGNGLIEVLDGENIVLIVQCDPSAENQLVDFILPICCRYG